MIVPFQTILTNPLTLRRIVFLQVIYSVLLNHCHQFTPKKFRLRLHDSSSRYHAFKQLREFLLDERPHQHEREHEHPNEWPNANR